MSGQTVVMILEAALLAVVIVFVVALLRSHAEILRRLEAIDAGGGTARTPRASVSGTPISGAAGDIVGETLAGDCVKLALGPGSPRTLLAFLTSGCAACRPLWMGLSDRVPDPDGTRLIVVTKGPEHESLSRLHELAPARHEVVMSSAAWEEFAVPASPHFVLVDGGAGTILGRGSAGSWEQIDALLADADGDRKRHSTRGTSQRAARAEEALAAAGITAGHPSLYPSRPAPSPGKVGDEPS